MDELAILGTFAAVTTVLPASLVAANLNAGVTVAGFMIFIVASIAWKADGWLETKDRSLALVSESREGSGELPVSTRIARRGAGTPC
jgi:hypothetical protein